MERRARIVVTFLIALIAGFAAFRLTPRPLPELSRRAFLAEVRLHHVSRVTIDGGVITGVISKRGPFRTAYDPADSRIGTELRKNHVIVDVDRSPGLTP